jgi:hypothetical protein
MPTANVPNENHVIRYVPWIRLRKDENDVVVGVLGVAFRLRDEEEYLSSTWLEFFPGALADALVLAIKAIRASDIDVRPKSGFAVGNVGKIKAACLEDARKHRIRIVHEKADDNEAHVALRLWPRDNDDLLDLIAEEVWNDLTLNIDVPV